MILTILLVDWLIGLNLSTIGGYIGLLVERDGRRIELALYVLSHAILSFYRTWHYKGLLPYIKHGDVITFTVSMSIMMWSYINHPYTVRYVRVFIYSK